MAKCRPRSEEVARRCGTITDANEGKGAGESEVLYRLFNVIVILFLTNVCNEMEQGTLYYEELGIVAVGGWGSSVGVIGLLVRFAASVG